MPIDDGCEDASYVAVQFNVVLLAGLNQGREHGPILGACVVTCEERTSYFVGRWVDCALNGVSVYLDVCVG